MKSLTPDAPVGLTPTSAAWWKTLVDDYDIIDSAGLLLLENAMRARDRMEQARALITEHGAVTVDRFGQLRSNPATTIERDSRAAMQSALKALNLDMEPLRDTVGRPPGG
jgi:phage terminase small subunit